MRMNELLRYDLPPEIIALWREQESETLLPLQEQAIKRFSLFGGENLLIQAPTSSGKTFIGEMAALQTALRGKKVVYLVPLKALAEEKYGDFHAKYRDYGLKVIVATRDHREFDRELEEGNFAIAVVVYEKLSQLLVRRPERIEEIDLVVADELEILSDPERGSMAELLLTRILRSQSRLIGLSAVIGYPERLAEWMRARLLYYERRPVELRFGVLHQGVFRYRTYNELGEGDEAMIDADADSSWEILTQNVCALAQQGEGCLVFVKAKHESRRGAELLAGRIHLPAAQEGIEALRRLESTRSRDCLLKTLAAGVAFHNADLSPDERRIVEGAFRAGEVKILVSTSTLAVGMNLPARNVFLTADKWRYDARLGTPWKTPILRAEYENMSGRAGRYGGGHDFGRSVLIAVTPFDYETYRRRYIDGDREHIEPRLAKEPLEDHVLRLVASRFCRTAQELLDFLDSTLTGRWVWAENYTLDEIEYRIRCALNRCMDDGMLTSSPENVLEATPFGLAAAAKGISIATARALEHWIGESENRPWSDIDLIFAAASTPDGRAVQVMLSTREYERADYPGQLKRLTRDEELSADVPMNRLRNCVLQPFFDEVRAIKIALFLTEWIAHGTMAGLEERYDTMAGQILSAAEQTSWIIDACAAIAAALGAGADFVERVRTLAERVQYGLDQDLLPLRRAGISGVTRGILLHLAGQGWQTPRALVEVHEKVLAQGMPGVTARALKAWAQRQSVAESEDADTPALSPTGAYARPALVVDDARPGEILLDGAVVSLQDRQYRLIRVLAEHPGVCVPYELIYQSVWGELIVEANQMHFQKRSLLKRIQDRIPDRAAVITTVPKRGFLLDLTPEEVVIKPLAIGNAA